MKAPSLWEEVSGDTLLLVESYWPGVSAERVLGADMRTRRSLGPAGEHLGSLLLPADELLLRIFRGPSRELIEAANRSAGIPVERVVEILALAPQSAGAR